MLKYHFQDAYDSKYKVRNRDIACFSKSKMKDMYPDGNYNVIGETILNNSKDKIDEIILGKTTLNVSEEGSHSKLFYKDAAYIYIYITDDGNNNEGGYVKLLKRRWLLLWLLLGLLLTGILVYFLLRPKDIPDTPTPIDPEPQHEDIPTVEKDAIYITLPTGTIEYRLVNDIKELDGYDLSIEINHDKSKDIIHSQKVKLNKDKSLENSELDFPSLTFELKVGNYEGKLIYTKDNERIEYLADILIRNANSGSMTISYSNEVLVNKSNNQISLNYKHDKDATNDVKLQIVLLDNSQEIILGESDIVKPGNSVSKLTLTNSNINQGTYDGYIRLFIIASDGSSTNVNTNIEVHITVK